MTNVFTKKSTIFCKISWTTVDDCYLEHLLSPTFTILVGPLNFSSNSRLKNIHYLELRYLKLSLSWINYLVPCFPLVSSNFWFKFLNWNVRTIFVFFTAYFRCFNMAVKRKLAVKTLSEKCQALIDLENGISNKNVAEKYGVTKNTVSTWLKNG